MVTFSVIIPTCGRPTLQRTLDSMVAAGFARGDEVLIIGDGPQPSSRLITKDFIGRGFRATYLESEPEHHAGDHQRNVAMPLAKGTHLQFIDDDDAFRPGALSLIRSVAAENPGRILMFKMQSQDPKRHAWAPIRWIDYSDPFIGNIGTPMFTVPNIPERLGVWEGRGGNQGGGDFKFMESTLAKWPGGKATIVWREEVIVDIY